MTEREGPQERAQRGERHQRRPDGGAVLAGQPDGSGHLDQVVDLELDTEAFG